MKKEFKEFCKRMEKLGLLEIKNMESLSDNNFIDKLSLTDLEVFRELEVYSYQEIQDIVRKNI